MVSTATALIVIGSIAGLLGFFALGGPSLFYDSGAQQASVINPGGSSFGGGGVSGTNTNLGAGDEVKISVTHFDTISRATLTEGTNGVTTVLRAKEGAQFGIEPSNNNPYYTIAATGTDKTIQLVASDNGLITISFEPASGQAYTLDINEFILANPNLVERYTFYDWDGDQDKEFVVQVNTKYLKTVEVTQQTPTLHIQVPWSNENTITLSAPADQGSLGTSPQTVSVYWEGTGTDKDVTYWRHLILRINQTGIDEFDVGGSYITLDGKRYILSEATNYGAVGSNYEWKFQLSNNIGEAPFHKFTTVAGTKVYMTTTLKIDLAADQNINVTLEVSTWDASRSPNAAVSDTVKLSA